ncbi:hypothetical protein [Homoserinibacter sp. GY 40078]|uniref:hypothetical protein n=1 Tax=Homoserinibacter sp. GY 40078 TaxID=2603275 RepID=UPI0011CBEFBB|nr:hypothetical protein [Homoserinibacter sp. GY 40078]TXK17740.1 hypothetical protein FVQ89_13155 [Homoserinibacter sp. GY 40078]
MDRRKARRARGIALRQLAYRSWYVDTSNGPIPSISILSDVRLQVREQERAIRRAQNGQFDAALRFREPVLRPAV